MLRTDSADAAIVQSLALLKTDREAVRAAHWSGLSIAVRRIAVMSANLPKERADDALSKFNAFERGRINLCIERLKREMEIIAKCMQAGDIPVSGEYSH